MPQNIATESAIKMLSGSFSYHSSGIIIENELLADFEFVSTLVFKIFLYAFRIYFVRSIFGLIFEETKICYWLKVVII